MFEHKRLKGIALYDKMIVILNTSLIANYSNE